MRVLQMLRSPVRRTDGRARSAIAAKRRQSLASSRPTRKPLSRSRLRNRSEEHTSELQSLMRISYAVFCLKKKKQKNKLPHIKHKRKMYTHIHNQNNQQTETYMKLDTKTSITSTRT